MGKNAKKSGKGFLIVILAVIIAAAVILLGKAEKSAEADKLFSMSGNAERVEFLNRQGYIVKPDPVSRSEVTIPTEFNDVYSEYADLQKQQGLDLGPYKGEKATVFTYAVLNYPEHPENIFADLLIANDRLIACELKYEDAENGFIKPLITKGIENSEAESETEPHEIRAETTTEGVTEPASELIFLPE